jgi:hypothetical protein
MNVQHAHNISLLHRVATWAAALLMCALLGGVALWSIGRVMNDSFLLTQYCFWMPTPVVFACAAALLVAITPLIAWITGAQSARTGRIGYRGWRGLWFVCALGVVCTGASLLFEWRAWRYMLPVRTNPEVPSLRVLAWNPATDYMDDFDQRVTKITFDVFALTNRPGHTKWNVLSEHAGGARSMARFGRLTMISKYRIIRWGGSVLGIQGARKRTTLWNSGPLSKVAIAGGEVSQDQGEAMFIEIDTTPLFGRTSVLWLVDIPSDPQLSRNIMFEQAAATLSAFRGPVFSRTDANMDVTSDITELEAGFPAFDLVMGDFNSPRGSRSIQTLIGSPGVQEAHSQAGVGWNGSWRRDYPVFTIDQMHTGARTKCTEYRVLDMGAGNHRAQVGTIEAREVGGGGDRRRETGDRKSESENNN